MFLYEAYRQVGVSLASLTYYCGPVIVMVLSPIIFKEKFTGTKAICFLTVFVGILLINGTAFKNDKNIWGIFCGAMSAVCYAFMITFNKKSKKISGLENSMLQLFISFLTVEIFVLTKQDVNAKISSPDMVPMLILGFINTGLGCYLYFSAVGKLKVQTIAICGYIEPLSAVLFSVVFLKERLFIAQIVGAVMIISGAVFAERKSGV